MNFFECRANIYVVMYIPFQNITIMRLKITNAKVTGPTKETLSQVSRQEKLF